MSRATSPSILPPSILFDLDGTLADTAPDLATALNHVLEAIGAEPVATADLRHMVGHGARALIERGLAQNGQQASAAELDELVARFLVHYEANIAVATRPFPGVIDALEALKARGARLAVCTNKREALSLRLLDALNMTHFFEAVAGSDTFAVFKPDPGHLSMTLERIGGDASRAVMVGDSETDVKAARAAGVPIVGVTFGYTATPIAEFAPDGLIDHFAELPDALARLMPELGD